MQEMCSGELHANFFLIVHNPVSQLFVINVCPFMIGLCMMHYVNVM